MRYLSNGMALDKGMLYGLKLIVGILVIAMMEMTLVKKSKGKPYTNFFIGIRFLLHHTFPRFQITNGY